MAVFELNPERMSVPAVDGGRRALRHGALLESPRAVADDARIGVDVSSEPELVS
jgi:hypothetical protein